MWPLSSREGGGGVKALVARPLKNIFFAASLSYLVLKVGKTSLKLSVSIKGRVVHHDRVDPDPFSTFKEKL